MAFDIVGCVDPTPITDSCGTVLAVSRGRWLDASFSVVGLIPYIGDLVKLSRIAKYTVTLERGARLARRSEKFARLVQPIMRRLDDALALLPPNPQHVRSLRRKLAAVSRGRDPVRRLNVLPDISRKFLLAIYACKDRMIHEVTGRLGIPGRVATFRSAKAQRSLSRNTGEDAGHLVGARFGAPPSSVNLGLQNYRANRYGTYKQMEDMGDRKLQQGTGITVRVRDVYRKGQHRPYRRHVEWIELSLSGKPTRHSLDFANTHTPRSRTLQRYSGG